MFNKISCSLFLAFLCFQEISVQNVYLRYFRGSSFWDHANFSLSDAVQILEEPAFSTASPTVFYIHGFSSSIYDTCTKAMIRAHIQKNNSNIIGVDWSALSYGSSWDYVFSITSKSKQVGKDLGAAIIKMIYKGLDSSKIHIVGHSLGAHMCGYAGRAVRDNNSKWLVPRITGLDPAYPMFYPRILFGLFGFYHLSSTDAAFVDIIHTDRFFAGAPCSTGSVDFWPNGGHRIQPGCPKKFHVQFLGSDECSHLKACFLWAESVLREDAFLAKKCHGKNKNSIAKMGYAAASGLTGSYYLKTNNSAPPVGLGMAGTDVCHLF